MKIIREAHLLVRHLNLQRQPNSTIGFVPTMGALHQGHVSLIQRSNAENDHTVVSIFVNPLQFNNPDDYDKYPITIEKDVAILESLGVQTLFLPERNDMYSHTPVVQLSFGYLENIMEGRFRPGHFQGVGLVVAKLLHMVHPDRAYFGQKDLQQCVVIKQLITDLSFNVEMITVPTERDTDGLALSSRNVRLSAEERRQAPDIYKVLRQAQGMLRSGKEVATVVSHVNSFFSNHPILKLEYFQVVDSSTLQPLDKITSEQASLCVAVHAGTTRLIDNIYLYD